MTEAREELIEEYFVSRCTDTDWVSEAAGPDGYKSHPDYPKMPSLFSQLFAGGMTEGEIDAISMERINRRRAFDEEICIKIGNAILAAQAARMTEHQPLKTITAETFGNLILDYAIPYLMNSAIEAADDDLGGIPTGGD